MVEFCLKINLYLDNFAYKKVDFAKELEEYS